MSIEFFIFFIITQNLGFVKSRRRDLSQYPFDDDAASIDDDARYIADDTYHIDDDTSQHLLDDDSVVPTT